MTVARITIGSRYNGPPQSGNGGVSAGLLAQAAGSSQGLWGGALGAPVLEVTLRQPPPLEVALSLRDGDLFDGSLLIAQVRPGAVTVQPPAAVGLVAATAAVAARPGVVHPFPTCFVCGDARGDGLGLLPGPVAAGLVATPYVPAASAGLAPQVLVWAALDCPGGWSVDLPGRPMLLGQMAVAITAALVLNAPHVVQGWLIGTQGRKVFTGSALYDQGGQVVALAQQTWVTVSR